MYLVSEHATFSYIQTNHEYIFCSLKISTNSICQQQRVTANQVIDSSQLDTSNMYEYVYEFLHLMHFNMFLISQNVIR